MLTTGDFGDHADQGLASSLQQLRRACDHVRSCERWPRGEGAQRGYLEEPPQSDVFEYALVNNGPKAMMSNMMIPNKYREAMRSKYPLQWREAEATETSALAAERVLEKTTRFEMPDKSTVSRLLLDNSPDYLYAGVQREVERAQRSSAVQGSTRCSWRQAM